MLKRFIQSLIGKTLRVKAQCYMSKLACGAIILLLGAYAVADNNTVYARVDSAVPVYQEIEELVPSERCWVDQIQEQTHYRAQRSRNGTLLGGLIGGAVGHAVGHGRSNKKLGVIVGGVIGASIGSQSDQKSSAYARTEVKYRDVERCEIRQLVQRRRELVGYDVRYSLDNRTYSARMSEKPGHRIRVAVQVTPIE